MILHSSSEGIASMAVKVIYSSMFSWNSAGLFLNEMLSRMTFELIGQMLSNLNNIFRREVRF
jgi:hypothetical protein